MLIKILSKIASHTQLWCERLAILAIVYLLGVVALNVVARVLFDLTGAHINLLVPGAIEQAKYALIIAVFAAFPSAIDSGLVRVDFLIEKLPDFLQALSGRLWFLVLCAMSLVLCVLFAKEAAVLQVRGDTTQDLHLPLFIFYGVIAIECAALALVSLAKSLMPTVQIESAT